MRAIHLSGCTLIGLLGLLGLLLAGCAEGTAGAVGSTPTAPACPVTEPAWEKPPEDAAVSNPPDYGHYFINADRSIWASAGWARPTGGPLRVSTDGFKVGWFRPAGETLEITARRTDGTAPPFEAHVPCCYPTRFQASGLYFPAAGCWEVTARAGESLLTFILFLEPEQPTRSHRAIPVEVVFQSASSRIWKNTCTMWGSNNWPLCSAR